MGFDPTLSAGERPQTKALDRAATGTGSIRLKLKKKGDAEVNQPVFLSLLPIYNVSRQHATPIQLKSEVLNLWSIDRFQGVREL